MFNEGCLKRNKALFPHLDKANKPTFSSPLRTCLVALLSIMLLAATAFGQGAGASLTGTIQDASGGVVPGASVTARNVDTGVESRTTSNDRGDRKSVV